MKCRGDRAHAQSVPFYKQQKFCIIFLHKETVFYCDDTCTDGSESLTNLCIK